MTLSEAIRKLGRPIAFYPWIARVIGIKQALLLCQLLYWTDKGNNQRGHGWIYKSCEELEEETCIPERTQRRLREDLVKRGLLDVEHDRENHRIWFRVQCEAVDKLADEHRTEWPMPPTEVADAIGQNGRSYKGTEITAEITAESAPTITCPECGFPKNLCVGHKKKVKIRFKQPPRFYVRETQNVQEIRPRSKGEERAERTRKALEVLDHPERLPEHLRPTVPKRGDIRYGRRV